MKIILALIFGAMATTLASPQEVPEAAPAPVATYSIVARDPVTGDLGVAVQSKFLAVGSVVPWAKAGVGAIATQAQANTTFGPEGLRMLAFGWTAQEVLDSLLAMDSDRDDRQVAIVDPTGNAIAFTGTRCQAYAGHKIGVGYAVQGNILAGAGVVEAMATAYETSSGDLADRLLATLAAAEKAGGDRRGRQSAALLVVRDAGGYGGMNDRFIDLRVDDHANPVVELRRIFSLWNGSYGVESRMESVKRFNANKQFAAAQEETRRVVESMNAQLRDHPDDPQVLNTVAWTLATYDIAKERAIELAKRAAKIAPGDPQIMNTLAECHYRLGQSDQAIAIASELVAKEPANEYYRIQLQKFLGAKDR